MAESSCPYDDIIGCIFYTNRDMKSYTVFVGGNQQSKTSSCFLWQAVHLHVQEMSSGWLITMMSERIPHSVLVS